MMDSVNMETVEIDRKVRAIVQFGPATPTSGFRGGEYYQVIIDPNMVSPKGDYIRFDQRFQDGEIHGWQRIAGITVCEILGDAEYEQTTPRGYTEEPGAKVVLRAIK